MAVIQNRSTEIGDVLYIKADVPIIGLIALQSFVDVTVGETGSKYFTRTFRYSVDGVNYSPWVALSVENLLLVEIQSNDTFFAEYNYQRAGSDSAGEIEFNSVTIDGQFSSIVDGPAYEASNFSQFFNYNNLCSIAWSVNVLEKLYKRGILPKYVVRDLNSTNATDRDFLDVWRAITHYFALFVCLARYFQTYYTDPVLLLEYLVQRGLFVCSDSDYSDLVFIMNNYYSEIGQRGTRKVFLPKGDTSSVGIKDVDGEYLRLINYNILDEFVYNLNRNQHIGWNIGNSSPLYKGTEDRLNLNKYYVDYADDIHHIHDISLADTSLPYVSIVADHDLDDESISHSNSDSESDSHSVSNSDSESQNPDHDFYKVIKISSPGYGNEEGIGKGDRRIIINPHLDYEVTFFIKAKSSSIPNVAAFQLFEIPDQATMTGLSITATLNAVSQFSVSATWQGTQASTVSYVAGLIAAAAPTYTISYDTTSILVTAPLSIGALGNSIAWTFGISYPMIGISTNGTFSGGEGGAGTIPTFTFGVDCWDKNDNAVGTLDISTLSLKTTFLLQESVNQADRYYFVRGILFNKNTYKTYDSTNEDYKTDNIVLYSGSYYRAKRDVPANKTPSVYTEYWLLLTSSEVTASLKTNIGKGNNLLLRDEAIKIDPFILYDDINNSNKDLYIYDVRVQILRTEYSKGFVQTTNLLELWNTNNNQMLSEQRVIKETRKYLIPANTALKINFVDSELHNNAILANYSSMVEGAPSITLL